jgi:hypothetical protein
MNAPGWRVGSIGGSDVAGILGIPMFHENGERARWSPTRWSVFAETVGLVDTDEVGDTERLDVGKDAEVFLAQVYERHHPGLYIVGAQTRLGNPEYPWLSGHTDGFVADHPDADQVVYTDGVTDHPDAVAGWEAKTSNDLRPWDNVPAFYQCQAQTYMILTGLPEWHFTVGFARWQVHHYTVIADPEDQAHIIAETERFWNDHVVTGIPPEPDEHPATTAAIKQAYNHPDADDIVFADEELAALHASLVTVKADQKAAAAVRAELENRIKVRMADCAELRYGDTVLATWRPQTTVRFDSSRFRGDHPGVAADYLTETVSRVFRLKTPKGET